MASSEDPRERYKDLLLEDVKSIYAFQHHLSNLRGLILGASLTVMGAIITYSRINTEGPGYSPETALPNAIHPSGFKIAIVHFLLLGIAYSTIKIIGTMNRALVLFGAYIDSVQKKVAGPAFWHCLQKYISATKDGKARGDKDTITHGFAIGVQQIGYAVSVYVLLSSAYYFVSLSESVNQYVYEQHHHTIGFGIALIISSIIVAIWLAIWIFFRVPHQVDTLVSSIQAAHNDKQSQNRSSIEQTLSEPDNTGKTDDKGSQPENPIFNNMVEVVKLEIEDLRSINDEMNSTPREVSALSPEQLVKGAMEVSDAPKI